MDDDDALLLICATSTVAQMKAFQDVTTMAAAVVVTSDHCSSTSISWGRYLKGGSIPTYKTSVWYLTDTKGDDLEFLHFLALTRESFNCLVLICESFIASNPIKSSTTSRLVSEHRVVGRHSRPSRRSYSSRDIIAMGLKYLISTAEVKQLHVQFGCVLSTYMDYVWFSMDSVIHCIGASMEGKVFWDRSPTNLEKCASLTSQFLDIEGVVAMVYGNKLVSFEPANNILQNRDYNGWTKDVNRNLILVWDPFGKIIDAGVNLP